MSPDFEIAIVGGGPAGSATALFLGVAAQDLGRRVVVIDKATFPRDKICAGAIGGRAEKLLASIGVRVDVPAAPVHGLSIATRCGHLTERCRQPIGKVVRRIDFDATLLELIRQRGTMVREGVRVVGLRRRGKDVLLDTSAGALSARAVVGADGVGSCVRRAIGIPPGPYHAQAVEVDTSWSASEDAVDLLCFDLSDRSFDGYAWDFPTVIDGRKMACRGVYQLIRRGSADERAQADVTALLRARLAERHIDATALRFKRFAERGLSLYQPTAVERVLLVGEAAGIDPVLGEGIPQAILCGHAAAGYLADCARRRDYRFGEYRSVLRRARVGVDLRVRAAATGLVYGSTRPIVERWITSSQQLARAGTHYFAGKRTPRDALLRAGLDFGVAAVREAVTRGQ